MNDTPPNHQSALEPTLEQRIDEKIGTMTFNFFEITGFQINYKMALKVGACLGYMLACEEYRQKTEREMTALLNKHQVDRRGEG